MNCITVPLPFGAYTQPSARNSHSSCAVTGATGRPLHGRCLSEGSSELYFASLARTLPRSGRKLSEDRDRAGYSSPHCPDGCHYSCEKGACQAKNTHFERTCALRERKFRISNDSFAFQIKKALLNPQKSCILHNDPDYGYLCDVAEKVADQPQLQKGRHARGRPGTRRLKHPWNARSRTISARSSSPRTS